MSAPSFSNPCFHCIIASTADVVRFSFSRIRKRNTYQYRCCSVVAVVHELSPVNSAAGSLRSLSSLHDDSIASWQSARAQDKIRAQTIEEWFPSKSLDHKKNPEISFCIVVISCYHMDDLCLSLQYEIIETQYKHRRSQRTHTHPYKLTHVHPITISISGRTGRYILRLTKSPHTPHS